MSFPTGFAYTTRKNGEIVITHHGRQAVVLRGRLAGKFLDQVEKKDPQEVMARFTGNYRRGNERARTRKE
jgi:hypothetical protein